MLVNIMYIILSLGGLKLKKNQIIIFPSFLNYDFENTTKRLKKINVFQIMFKGIGTSLVMNTIDKGEGVLI